MRYLIAIICMLGCAESVEVDPVGDYQSWPRSVEVRGNAPGHSNSIRVIYANDIAANAPSLYLGYPEGSIFVKEVWEDEDGERGALRYLALMRRIGPVTTALQDEGGWLYTETDGPDGPEQYFNFCWNRCHVVAPYNGAFYDYRP